MPGNRRRQQFLAVEQPQHWKTVVKRTVAVHTPAGVRTLADPVADNLKYIEDLTRVVISYEIYKTSLRRVS